MTLSGFLEACDLLINCPWRVLRTMLLCGGRVSELTIFIEQDI